MAKSSYIQRAEKFVKLLADILVGKNYKETIPVPFQREEIIWSSVCALNQKRHWHAYVNRDGSTRTVIICSDYVIKMDKTSYSRWGTSKNEYANYKLYSKTDIGKYLAPIHHVSCNGYNFYIMPKCTGVGKTSFPDNIQRKLDYYFDDLHSLNIAKYHGQPILIDYAAQ